MKFSEILQSMGGKTDKELRHGYGEWYDIWFEPRQTTAMNVLEIGVCQFGGGCILSLAQYFEQATIWAADIDDSRCCQEVFQHPRIKFLKGNAYDQDFLVKLGKTKFDVIIDDASHEVDDQIQLAIMLRPFFNDGGLYVIEDCCCGHWLPKLHRVWEYGYKQTIIDRSTKEIYDNTLIKLGV